MFGNVFSVLDQRKHTVYSSFFFVTIANSHFSVVSSLFQNYSHSQHSNTQRGPNCHFSLLCNHHQNPFWLLVAYCCKSSFIYVQYPKHNTKWLLHTATSTTKKMWRGNKLEWTLCNVIISWDGCVSQPIPGYYHVFLPPSYPLFLNPIKEFLSSQTC